MRILLPFLLCMLFASVTAQDRPEVIIDSLYGVSYPYKKQIQQIGSRSGVSVSIIRLAEESTGKEVMRCRLSVVETGSTIGSPRNRIVLLRAEQIEYLMERLNKLYVISKSAPPKTYTEYPDELRTLPGRLWFTLFAAEGRKWTFRIRASDLGVLPAQTDLTPEGVVKLNGYLQTCLTMINR